MIYNKITLAFPEKEEKLFLKKYFFNSLNKFRVAFVLVIFLYGIFGFLDSLILQEHAKLFHIIRYIFVIPILSVVFLLSFTKVFQKIWQVLLFISFIIGGFGIIIMTLLVPDNYSYYFGMMLIFSAGYFFIQLRFFLASIAGWGLLLIFNLGAIFYLHAPNILLINTNFFFISANIIGMFAAYNIEYYARRNFFLNYELDKEKLLIEEINNKLEKTVQERTRELQKAKEKAEESDRLKSAFLANMSHEIRTPMNGILGFTNLLKEPNLSGKEKQRYIDIIQKSGDRMLNTVNDIIDISRIESGVVDLSVSEVNIIDKLIELHSFFTHEASKKGIQLVFKNDRVEQEIKCITDLEKLGSILTNLIKNAIKFTNQGTIELAFNIKEESGSPKLEFYVKDSGIGIPKNRQKAIFDRFVQADIEDKQANQGSGLGLTISKAYAELLGGRLWVESEEGIGSTFYFNIDYNPVSESKSSNKDDEQILKVDETSRKVKILVVEDDETSQYLISVVVDSLAKEIITVISGFEAVEAAASNLDIDLILMDIRLPDINGYEATRQIRKFNKDVIIIAQTAHALTGDREKAIDAGCNDYITKPIDKEKLLSLIEQYIYKA